jgi:hypothetical protein
MNVRSLVRHLVVVAASGLLAVACGSNSNVTGPGGGGSSGASFHVTAVASVAPTPPAITAACPFKVVFVGRITTDGPGTVHYVWLASDGRVSGDSSVDFAAASTQEVVTSWTLGDPGTANPIWMAVRVTSPNVMESDHANVSLTCTK